MRQDLENSWKGKEPSPIEFFHSELGNQFHEFRLSITNETTINMNGKEFNDIVYKAKKKVYEKYKGLDLEKPVDKEQLLTKRYFKELGFEFPRNEEELKQYEEKFKDFPYKLEGVKIDADKIMKQIK